MGDELALLSLRLDYEQQGEDWNKMDILKQCGSIIKGGPRYSKVHALHSVSAPPIAVALQAQMPAVRPEITIGGVGG